MSETPNKAPIVYLPRSDVGKELSEYMVAIAEMIQVDPKLMKVVSTFPRWYERQHPQKIFKDVATHQQLIELLDFLENLCAYDEIITDYTEENSTHIQRKANALREAIYEARNHFILDIRGLRILHINKLLGMYDRGRVKLEFIRAKAKHLVESYKQFIPNRAFAKFMDLEKTRIESVKYPEGMRLPEPPDEFTQGGKKADELLDEWSKEQDDTTNEVDETGAE